jgi:hypothetical protein
MNDARWRERVDEVRMKIKVSIYLDGSVKCSVEREPDVFTPMKFIKRANDDDFIFELKDGEQIERTNETKTTKR